MKYYLPLLAFILFTVPSWGIDFTIPEEPYSLHTKSYYSINHLEPIEPIEIPKKYLFNFGDYKEPPTKTQYAVFWTLNVLDVWTTHRALKECPNCREMNPLLPEQPKLEELILQKAVIGGLIHWQGSKDYMNFINMGLTFAVVNNYNIAY